MGYNMKSMKAEEFINDEEILESLAFAKKNKDNQSLINEILEKAKKAKGISHKEAAVLMECDIPEVNEQIKELAKEIKQKFYGNRIVMFAPLYLSNYCVNGCTYCPYHYKNKHIHVRNYHRKIFQWVVDRIFSGFQRQTLMSHILQGNNLFTNIFL